MADKKATIPLERIESRIFFIREQKVMFDADLAWLYEVETRALVQAQAQHRAVSSRFHVPVDPGGVRFFEITICDLKS